MKKIICFLTIVMLIVGVTFIPTNAATKSPRDFKTNGNGGKTDVGTWYCTYHNSGMFARNFGTEFPIKFRALMPDGSYGILDSSVVEYIDWQLKNIAEAKIDFILFDNTNGGFTEKVPYGDGNWWIVDNTILACERIAEWNKNNEWQLRYAQAIGAYEKIRSDSALSIGEVIEYQAEAIYKDFYKNETYGDAYYTIEGKPLLVVYHWAYNVITCEDGWDNYKGDRTYGDKFTVRAAQLGEKGTYGWDNRKGPSFHPEVMIVCPGHATHGDDVYPSIYRDNGAWYRKSWETVLNNTSPRIVMISSFNDYHENTGVFITDSSNCVAEYDEVWYDVNGNINPTMYWDMTKEGINKLRVKNGDKIKGLDTSVSVDGYITVGEGIAKKPEYVATKLKDPKVYTEEELFIVGDFEDEPILENSSGNTLLITIIIISTIVLLAVIGLTLYFIVFKKTKKVDS